MASRDEDDLVMAQAHNHFSLRKLDIKNRRRETLSTMICGGDEIHKIITKKSDMEGVRLLPSQWKKITRLADEFISQQTSKIDSLERDLMRLTEEYAQVSAASSVNGITPAKV